MFSCSGTGAQSEERAALTSVLFLLSRRSLPACARASLRRTSRSSDLGNDGLHPTHVYKVVPKEPKDLEYGLQIQ